VKQHQFKFTSSTGIPSWHCTCY